MNRKFHLFRLFISILSIFIVVFFLSVSQTHAITRRKLSGASNKVFTTGVGISARLRPDRRAVILTVSHLQLTTSVSYLLTYDANGKSEGAAGAIKESGYLATRELLFGTCSKGVCTYHVGITNARLEVTANLKSGRTLTKRFRIRV